MKRRKFHGELILMYVMWYGAERFFVEGLRTDSLMVGSFRISQVIAAIGTFVIAIFLMFVDQIASALSGNFIGTILTWISFTSRYDTFTQGIFSVSSCVYFISVAAVFVFLTARRVESRRWN